MNPEFVKVRQALPTGMVTFLFSDIEGSTRLAQQHPEELPSLLGRHHSILKQSIHAHHGYVFQIIGDAFCAAFHTPQDALNAALIAQRSLQHELWKPVPIQVRMGLHTGLAQVNVSDDQSVNYAGYLTLAHVQNIMSLAYGGQVLLSNSSANLLLDSMPPGILLRNLGEHQLKNGLNREQLWQLVADDLRVEFPPLKTLTTIPNNLPAQLTSFVGREQELARTKELLGNTALLTLIGPGGTGKTRLALQLAKEILPDFGDGVWQVELAPLADPALVLQTVAATLGIRDDPGGSLLDQLTNHLRTRQLLLILDNCEHLVESCVHLAGHLLRSCPTLKMIASSREALGIAGETVYRVPPLALPDSAHSGLEFLRHSEAVQLFLERAAAVKPGFILTGHNAPAVANICLRLDGIPLALELAAARISMLTPEEIATRLDDRFRLLTGGSRTALPRQQTLRSLIDWSYDLLSEPERQLLCQLSVFVGGWSLEAAEAVCPELDILELLAQLVQKSLVTVEQADEQAATRYRLLETIRQYARDRLLEMGTIAQARDRHLEYYLHLAENWEIKASNQHRLEWVNQCEIEHDNFRAALQWGLDHKVEAALRLGGALSMFWTARGYNIEGRGWLQAALDRAAALPEADGGTLSQRQAAQAKGLVGFCQVFYGLGEYQASLEASRKAVQLYRQLGDKGGLGFALCAMGNMAAFQSDLALAEQTLQEAIQIGHEVGSKMILTYAYGVLSHYVALPRGDLSAARLYAEESGRYARAMGMSWADAQGDLIIARISSIEGQWDAGRQHALKAMAVFQDLRDRGMLSETFNELADIELRAGNYADARRYLMQCIVAGQEMGLLAFVAHSLESFAYIAQAQDQPERAARLLGSAEAVREGIGTSSIGVHRLDAEYESTVAWLHTVFDETTYHALWSEGCAMTVTQAVAYALEK